MIIVYTLHTECTKSNNTNWVGILTSVKSFMFLCPQVEETWHDTRDVAFHYCKFFQQQ